MNRSTPCALEIFVLSRHQWFVPIVLLGIPAVRACDVAFGATSGVARAVDHVRSGYRCRPQASGVKRQRSAEQAQYGAKQCVVRGGDRKRPPSSIEGLRTEPALSPHFRPIRRKVGYQQTGPETLGIWGPNWREKPSLLQGAQPRFSREVPELMAFLARHPRREQSSATGTRSEQDSNQKASFSGQSIACRTMLRRPHSAHSTDVRHSGYTRGRRCPLDVRSASHFGRSGRRLGVPNPAIFGHHGNTPLGCIAAWPKVWNISRAVLVRRAHTRVRS